MRSTWLFSGRRTSASVAMKSTCPDSGWPPISAPSRAARSTLTRLPACKVASVVSASDCCMTSKSAASLPCSAVTVRQVPSTATLAPTARPARKPGGSASLKLCRPGRSVTAATVAIPWTMPVNMGAELSSADYTAA